MRFLKVFSRILMLENKVFIADHSKLMVFFNGFMSGSSQAS
jgi:hypothetical protein